jgi:glyoxylase-like metal-dependent hydrolase (beta-lactamase superfamily II)
MIGLKLPDVDTWSERVTVALGRNPNPFTGPGTNTLLIGTGHRRILLDTGDGSAAYLPVLEQAMARTGCREIQEIVVTHGHRDHIGGAARLIEHFGPLEVKKKRFDAFDAPYPFPLTPLEDGDVLHVEGATLRALHTPGHSPDHLCFLLEEESALFSGDHVLGVGTSVIPSGTGSLDQYMRSLERLLAEVPRRIYPAHGPLIEDGCAKLREYIDHRHQRDQQILAALAQGAANVTNIVDIVYAAYPKALHAAAGESVTAHLIKLEAEGRVTRDQGPEPLLARWGLGEME